MREAKVVVDMIQGELLPQAVLSFAECGHPSPHRGDMVAHRQVEALNELLPGCGLTPTRGVLVYPSTDVTLLAPCIIYGNPPRFARTMRADDRQGDACTLRASVVLGETLPAAP